MCPNEKYRYFSEFSDNLHGVLSFFDIAKVNIFFTKTIHILEVYQNVTKHLFQKNICKPHIPFIFYVDKVDNLVDNSVFAHFSTFFNVDNFFSFFEGLSIFLRQIFLIVQTDDFNFFIHIFYPHPLCGKCG